MISGNSHWPPLVGISDHARLSALMHRVPADSKLRRRLAEKLRQSCLMLDDQLPPNAIRLGSTVTFEAEGGPTRTITVVHPSEIDAEEARISILAPVGLALFGLRPRQRGEWIAQDGRKRHATILGVEGRT